MTIDANRQPRIQPSIAVAVGLWLAYTVVVNAIQASAGVPYAEWFTTAHNAWRIGVLSLAAGAVLLAAFAAYARWDHLWREPRHLGTTTSMKAAMVICVVAIAIRIVGVRWSTVPIDLLASVVASGILVGFAEETLFRGVFLRALREGGRNEAAAGIWTAVGFGLFHLPNVFMGSGWMGLVQVVMAGLLGTMFYAFRRHYGVLWPAMVAHGVWDISLFVSGYAREWLIPTTLVMQVFCVGVGIAVFVSLRRHDRQTIAIPARSA